MSWLIPVILLSSVAGWIYLLHKSLRVYKKHLCDIEAAYQEQMDLFTRDYMSAFHTALQQPAEDLMALIDDVRHLKALCDERAAFEQEIIKLKAILARKEKK